MQGQVLHKRYGIIRTVTETPLCQSYLAEDLLMPGNPNCWLEAFRPSAQHPTILKTAQYLFRKEATLLKTLTVHPHLLTVLDYFEAESCFYLVQDWLPGSTLADQLATGAILTESEVIELLQHLLDVIAVVHDNSTVHGNLSPQSLVLSPITQDWIVRDFGAVHQIGLLQLNSHGKVTLSRRVGDARYCPPRWSGKLAPAYDLYSLGRIALQSLTGTTPEQLPEDWQDGIQVSDRLHNVLEGLLTQIYSHASEAQQWLRGTAATMVTGVTGITGADAESLDFDAEAPSAMTAKTKVTGPNSRILAGRYRILRPLGDGGFGRTFLAQDDQFPGQPKCVVKHLRPYSTTPEMLALARRLFLSEADVLSRLGQHPQIPHLLAHFEEEAEFYLVQDYIDGHDLSAELERGKRWSEAKVLRLLTDILDILSFVHEQQVIHRDIKPANIRRRTDGKVVLIDFGAVKSVGEQLSKDERTQLTVAIGTPGYAPSEQTQGKPRLSSDVYAVGMIAIEALTGLDPEKLPEDPRTGELLWHDNAKVSPALRRVIDKMVRYDFRQRYPTAKEARAALAKMKTAQATVVRSLEQLQESQHFPKPWIWGGIAAVAIALIASSLTLRLVRQPASSEGENPVVADADQGDAAPEAPNTEIAQLPATIVPLPFAVTDAVYSRSLNRLLMISRDRNQLHIYSPLSQRFQSVAVASSPTRISLDPTGRFAAIANDNQISLVNVQQNQVAKVIPVTVAVHDLALVSDRWAYFSSAQDNRLWGVNLQTEEILATEDGQFERTQQTLHPRGQGLVSLDATGTKLRYVDISDGQPTPTAELTSSSSQSLGERLWFSGDGRSAFTNRGVRLTVSNLTRDGELVSQNLAFTHRQNANHGRVAIAPNSQTLFAFDGPQLGQLVQFNITSLNRQKTWKLPPITEQGSNNPSEGRFIFVNPQGSEYYIVVQVKDDGAFGLLRGTF